MKKIIHSIKMMFTAVLCFTICMIFGKNKKENAKTIIADGHAVPYNTKKEDNMFRKIKYTSKRKLNDCFVLKIYKERKLFKKIFFWLKGPGDRGRGAFPCSYLSGFV